MALKVKSRSFSLPFGIGEVSIEADATRQKAAWALHVELATRIAAVPLAPGTGTAREALNEITTSGGTPQGRRGRLYLRYAHPQRPPPCRQPILLCEPSLGCVIARRNRPARR